ncbi:hypothetical protein HanIR_Chr04g0199361 [Helianthus annuus]|nr:hypothetical protein HanIR_Chr04g0199361 [Helianthus annuus]
MFMLLCSPMISPKRKPNVKEIEGTVKKKNETNCFYLGTTGREQQKKQKRRKRRCGRAAGDENETRLGCSNRLIDFNSSRAICIESNDSKSHGNIRHFVHVNIYSTQMLPSGSIPRWAPHRDRVFGPCYFRPHLSKNLRKFHITL